MVLRAECEVPQNEDCGRCTMWAGSCDPGSHLTPKACAKHLCDRRQSGLSPLPKGATGYQAATGGHAKADSVHS